MAEPHSIDSEIDPASLKRRAVHGGLTTVVSQGVKFLLRIGSQIAIARLLMPADYGLIAMVAPILALVQLVAELGLGQALVQRPNLRQAEISSLFWFGVGLNLVLALVLAAASPLVAMLYGEPRLAPVAIALAVLIPISGSAMAHGALLARNMRFGTQALLDIAPPAVGLAVGLSAALSHLGYWSLVAATAAESVCGVAIVWTVSRWRPSRPAYDPEIWSLVRVGGHVLGYNLATLVTSAADNVLLGVVGGKVQLGLYDRGYKLVTQPISQLLSPFSRVAVPLLMRLQSDDARYRSAFLTMVQLMLLASVPGLLFGAMFAGPLVLLLLGEKWGGAAPIISWVCMGALASPLYNCTFWLFVTQGRTRQQLAYVFAVSAVAVASFAAGLPWGAVGVSAGAAISFLLITTPVVCWGATRAGPVGFADLTKAILPLAAAGVSSAGALYGLKDLARLPTVVLLGAGASLSYATFAIVLFCIPSGRQLLKNTWALREMLTRRAA